MNAQTWVDMMQDPNANYYETVTEFNNYWAGRTVEKGKGYKAFRRWEEFMGPRVYPKGDVKQAARAYEEFLKYKADNPGLFDSDRAANWTPLGPYGTPTGGGAGRINAIRFDPTNSNTVYACTPAGGLWKSTNSGTSWTTNTDALSVIGCTDVCIDPTNTNIMYLATSDGDAGDTYSIGVLKSTDAGATWAATGLAWSVTNGRTISKMLINPSNPLILIAATSNGIYRTTNGGTSWTQVQTGNFKDLEYKPGDPLTVYACGATTFYRSADGGATWTNITAGVPTTAGRLALAVSPANATYVYILAANNTDNGFLGVYRSTNSGTSFTTRSTTPNLLGWNSTGSDAGGQGWYDLSIAASETNADVVLVGGVNIWRSTNGGTSWTINAHWTGTGAPYVHADHHDVIFLPGSGTTYWSGNDGGAFRTTTSGTAWTDLSSNCAIAQQYKIGLSATTAGLITSGHQDNGTNKLNAGSWSQIYGGDGMETFIDRTNNNIMYASLYYGDYRRSTNAGATWTTIVTGLTGTAAWVAPWHQDPVTSTTLYAGYSQMFKTTNSGTSWSQIGTIAGTGTITEFDVAPSNPLYIYAVRSNVIYKTTNGGTSWTNMTGTLPVGSAALTNVEISPTDPLKVWVTFSGYSSGNKVFMTTDGGTTWTNYSTGLPNLPANCIVYQNASSDGVYVGTDVGVYYRDATLTTWQPYLTGLPNVIVRDLEIFYGTGKLRAGTYGRGTWESDLYSPGTNPPIANFTANRTVVCPGSTVNFTDLSAYSPTSWSWSFIGGTPATSTLQNPVITYNTPGTYAVTLTATNAYGSNSKTTTAYITVLNSLTLPLTEGFESATFAPTNWAVSDVNGNGLTWQRNGTFGAYGTSTACALWDNYNNNDAGARDQLWSSTYNFTGYSSATLTFDVAYARYNATYSDTLSVWVSTNCGATYTQLYIKGGTTLSTNGGTDVTAAIFTPTTAQWRNESVNMTPYVGNPSVLIQFRNHARYGQALYLDNINITGVPAASPPVADFTGAPTTICAGSTVTFTNLSTGATSYNWSFTGGTPATSTATNPTVTYNTPGTYDVTLVATNASGSNTKLRAGYITVVGTPTTSNAGPDFSICTTSGTATMAGNTPTSGTGLWTQVSGPITGTITTASSATTTVTGLTTVGTYVFQWTISNSPCTASSDQITVTVNAAPTTANAGIDQTICATLGSATMAGNAATSGTGAWTQTAGPITATITTASSPTTTITGMTTAGTYTFQWTISNAPCTASTDVMNVVVNAAPTTANAGADQTVCAGSTVTMAGNTATSGTGTWTKVSGPAGGTITTASSPTTTITALVAGTYTYQWTITNAPCAASNDQMIITVSAAPTTANAGIDQTICTSSTLTFAGNTAASGTGLWTQTAGPITATITTPTSPTSTATGLTTAGTYTFQWTISNAPCTASSDIMVVTVNPGPTTSNAGPDQTICVGSTVTMAGNTPIVGTGTWSKVSGPAGGTITTPSSPTTTITALGVGTYTYQWTIVSGGCPNSTDQMTITVSGTPTTSNAGIDQTICTSSTLTFAGNTPTSGTGLWTQTAGPISATITTPTSPISTATGFSTVGTYTFQWTISNAPCTASSDVMIVTVSGGPTIANAGPDQTVCVGTTVFMTGNTPTVGSGLWTKISGPAGGTISSATNPTTTITGLTVGTYVYQWTITSGGCPASTDQMTIIVNGTPTTANAGADKTICATSGSSTMTGNTATSGTGLWTQVSGPLTATITTPASPTTTITGMTTPGTYVFTWTISNAPCTASSDNVNVIVNGAPTSANAGPDQTVCIGSTVTMAGNTASTGTGTWTKVSGPAGGTITTASSPTSTITALGVGTYVYQWTITNAPCTASSDQMTIIVNGAPTTALAGADQTICETTTMVTMAGNTATSGTGTWIQVSGPSAATITTPSSPTTTISSLTAGVYTFEWTITNSPCTPSTDQMTVTVNGVPTSANAGADQTVCDVIATLNANTPSIGTGTWTFISGPITPAITTPSASNSGVTGLSVNGTYVFQWTIANAPCTASSDQVTLNVSTMPTANATDNGPLCEGATLNLNTPAVGGATYSWSGPLGFVSGFQSPSLSGTTVTNGGVYTVIVNLGICSDTSSTNVVINSSPIADAGLDVTLCAGDSTTLNATGGISYSWSPSTNLSSSIISNPSANPTSSTTYVVSVSNGTCADSDTVVVNVNPTPPVPTITQSNDTLYASPSTGFSYQWYLNGSPISGATNNFYVVPVNGDYTVVITNGLSCNSTSAINTYTVTGLTVITDNSLGSIVVVPNPNSGLFVLNLDIRSEKNLKLYIHNDIGQIVYTQDLSNTGHQQAISMQLSNVESGLYTLTVTDGAYSIMKKLVIK